ncbi:ADP-ribosylglycohydrolase family protein [Jiulongibacter sediminis]|jgi:hypothetical protein|uniref:ADP-ribosylglycohydrolase family protein n=1 Tax=Jiulongibacter sediminis TaxID=1605367 RepID=UPI0026F0D8F2|nr:ADP-ribosylglycohydrolase family protein [Jiulongibacter sediminis]
MKRFFALILILSACKTEPEYSFNPDIEITEYKSNGSELVIDRVEYQEKLEGFWLGQCIANWTGLITEMDKIGGEGLDGKGAGFYTRENWGGPDEPNIWGSNELSDTIGFYFEDSLWGADDDTDIEYIYQELLLKNKTSLLSGEQIRDGWLKHMKQEEENYLWVSNQTALNLMLDGVIPPATSAPENNPDYEMIDAQLTTEIFGLFAPGRPDFARKMAQLPINTTARENAEWISQFYVTIYSLAAIRDGNEDLKTSIFEMADEASGVLPENSYSASMYRFVKEKYEEGVTWEQARDGLHEKYQVRQEDGYVWSTQDKVCNGCFAAGINFGASLISFFYGEGDLKETIKIGALSGWDSDNPTATWGGMLGFMLGKSGIEKAFGRTFGEEFNIHRTRVGFPNDGIDNFENMAQKGLFVIDRVVQENLGGGVDPKKNCWYIPQ